MTVVFLRAAGCLALRVMSLCGCGGSERTGVSPARAEDARAPTAARPWRLVYATEARARRLDAYVADVPGGTPRRVPMRPAEAAAAGRGRVPAGRLVGRGVPGADAVLVVGE